MVATINILPPEFLEAEQIRKQRAQLELLWNRTLLQDNFSQQKEYESKSKEQLVLLVQELLTVEPAVFKATIDEAALTSDEKAFVLSEVADELTIRIPDFLADPEEIVELGLVEVVIKRACQVEEESNCIKLGQENIEEAFKREDDLFFGYPVLCERLVSLTGPLGDEVIAEITDLKEITENLEIKDRCIELLTKKTLWQHL